MAVVKICFYGLVKMRGEWLRAMAESFLSMFNI